MANFTNTTIIVEAANRINAQAVSSDQYFNAGASVDGTEPATHYFMSGPLSNDEVDAIVNTTWKKWVRSPDWQAALTEFGVLPIIDTTTVV